MGLGLTSRTIVFVHGIFGWGEHELPFSYWGNALEPFAATPFAAHEIKCGPVSSFRDRACELFAQIKGGDFIYETSGLAAGVKRARVPRAERPRVGAPLLPDWSAQNPIVLVAHSAGAHACLALQRLLAVDHFGVGSNADWIEAVISISGVLNGSTLTYWFGCDPATGVLTGHPERLIGASIEIVHRATQLPLPGIEPWLEQWSDRHAFVSGRDNLAFDLTLTGCRAANEAFATNPNTYYLALVTSMPVEPPRFFGIRLPRVAGGLNIFLEQGADYQAEVVDFKPETLPLPDWGTKPELTIDAWRENDGAVSAISQRFPFTARDEPFGREGIFDGAPIHKGQWHFQRVEQIVGERFDHLDPVFGARMKLGVAAAQRELYGKLAALL